MAEVETPEQFALRAEQEATDDELRLDERALIRMVRERDAAIREAERAASERRIAELEGQLQQMMALGAEGKLIEFGHKRTWAERVAWRDQRIAEIEAKVPRWIPVEEREPAATGHYDVVLENGMRWKRFFSAPQGSSPGYMVGWRGQRPKCWLEVTLPSPPAEPAQEAK